MALHPQRGPLQQLRRGLDGQHHAADGRRHARLVGAGRDLVYTTLGADVLVLGAAFALVYYSLRLVEEGSA